MDDKLVLLHLKQIKHPTVSILLQWLSPKAINNIETLKSIKSRANKGRLRCVTFGINEENVYWHVISIIIPKKAKWNKCLHHFSRWSLSFPQKFSLYGLIIPERPLSTDEEWAAADTAVEVATCQIALLLCIKYALHWKHTEEGNPGKSHYPSLIWLIKFMPLTWRLKWKAGMGFWSLETIAQKMGYIIESHPRHFASNFIIQRRGREEDRTYTDFSLP